MIREVWYWWKQLNGPRVSALMKGILQFFRDMFDPVLDYYHDFSIETAQGEHLTVMGEWANFVRPIVNVPVGACFNFTDGPLHNSPMGVSDGHHVAEDKMGGVFTDWNDTVRMRKESIRTPDNEWRILLRTFVDNEAQLGSLEKLDAVLQAVYKVYRPDAPVDYNYEILTKPRGNMGTGDVLIRIGSPNVWGDAFDVVYYLIKSLADTIYSPEPRLWLDSGVDGEAMMYEEQVYLLTSEVLGISRYRNNRVIDERYTEYATANNLHPYPRYHADYYLPERDIMHTYTFKSTHLEMIELEDNYPNQVLQYEEVNAVDE